MKTIKTLAIFSLCALLFVGCADDKGENNEGLVLSVDNLQIYNNGGADEYGIATFSLSYNGVSVENTTEVQFFDEDYNLVPIVNMQFSSTEIGAYTFTAMLGTEASNKVIVEVINTPPPAPAAPVDNNPSKLNFKRRVMLVQFTGNTCGYCPYMINALHTLMTTPLADDVILTAAHLYSSSDPAYLYYADNLDAALGVHSFPRIIADMKRSSAYEDGALRKPTPSYEYVQKLVKHSIDRVDVKAGIAVNCEYKSEEKYVMVTALVKAKQSAELRAGAWLVEDDIYAKQSINNNVKPLEGVDFNTHNNCIRLANSRRNKSNYTGIDLGTVKAGESKAISFALPLKNNGEGGKDTWNHDNLRVVVFVSSDEGNDDWYVNNVITAPIDGVKDFEYEE